MAVNDFTKDLIKMGLGLFVSILLISIQWTISRNQSQSEELKQKVDKIYDYATNHEVRMKVIEEELQDHRVKILDLQLAQERLGVEDLNNLRKKNNTQVSPK
jgi:hypothetical protein